MLAAGLAVGATAVAGCEAPAPKAAPGRGPVVHQPGVLTPPPEYATLVSCDLIDGNGLVDRLAEKVAGVHAGGAATVTVGVGATLFDKLGTVRPRFLTGMPGFANDVLDSASCGGDLLLQICAADPGQAHAVAENLSSEPGLRSRWRIDGFRAENSVTPAGLPTTRNLFGFREGAGNPDPADPSLMDEHVWAGEGEPGWAIGGTYQVVRLIRLATVLWNRDSIPQQEAVFGRHRADGTPLAGGAEDGAVDYAADPDGQLTPLDAHMRRADPRTPESRRNRILRRSYSYRDGDDEGLIFICFQRDPEAGFATVQRRLAGETLDKYVLPFGGGYFFVPPSIAALRSAFTV